MNKKICVFCNEGFPFEYQIVSEASKYWTLVHDINPMCDFHCLLILKRDSCLRSHVNNLGTDCLSNDVFAELGILLNRTCNAIKRSSKEIINVNIASLNSGEDSKHLHFHFIPTYRNENVKKVNSLNIDGGGFSFLSKKEIMVDTLNDFICSTCGEDSMKIESLIKQSLKKRVSSNVRILKKNFL